MPKPPKPKAVVFVTTPPSKAAAPSPDGDSDDDQPFEGFMPVLDDDGKPLLFQPHPFRPIETPSEFDTEEKANLYRCSIHEVGHAIGSLIVCREVRALTVASINGSIRGSAFSSNAHGEDAAIVDLAGIAAEQLIVGSGDCHAGAQTDIGLAREHLRDDGVPENMIDRIMQDIHRELQRIFARDWVPGIKAAATKLAQTGILDWDGFIELVSRGQREAVQAGSLRKSLDKIRGDSLHKTSEFTAMADQLEHLAKAHQFDAAADEPGISAHQVAVRETLRNRADMRFKMAGGK